MKKSGAYIGRFNPVHLGHIKVIEEMIKNYGFDNSILVIGSSNTPQSLRHFFSYNERRNFIKKLFPELRIVGLPDYQNDQEWLRALDDILEIAGIDPKNVTFFGGCLEDLRFFDEDGRDCTILNRFEMGKISATEVRDALIHKRDLDGLVHKNIIPELGELFKEKWENFKKM